MTKIDGDLGEALTEALGEAIDLMPDEWDRIGRAAVLFGYCYHAAGLNMAEAERAFRRFKGATDWMQAHKPLPGETIQ